MQRILEDRGIPYAGTRSKDLPMSFDKILTKRRLLKHGLPTAPFEIFEDSSPQILMSSPFVLKAPLQVNFN